MLFARDDILMIFGREVMVRYTHWLQPLHSLASSSKREQCSFSLSHARVHILDSIDASYPRVLSATVDDVFPHRLRTIVSKHSVFTKN